MATAMVYLGHTGEDGSANAQHIEQSDSIFMGKVSELLKVPIRSFCYLPARRSVSIIIRSATLFAPSTDIWSSSK